MDQFWLIFSDQTHLTVVEIAGSGVGGGVISTWLLKRLHWNLSWFMEYKTKETIFIGLTFVHFISVHVDKRFNKAKSMYTKNTFI